MKILKITYEWPPPWEGLVPHPYELAVAQTKLGHEISVFSGRWPMQGSPEEPEKIKLIHFLGSPSLPFRAPFYGTLLITFAPLLLLRYLVWRKKSSNSVDIIHSHGHFGLWIYFYRSLLAKYLPKAKELKTPIVVHFHNTVAGRWEKLKEQEKSLNFLTEKIDWPLARYADKLAVAYADALVFVSEDLKQEAIKYYDADPSKCFVLESGVNPDLFKPMGPIEKENIVKDLGLEPKDILLLNLGMLVERKNIHLLIEALRLLPGKYKLLLVGPFPDSDYKERINKLVQSYKLEERVLFGGVQPYPQVPILYQGADLFVLPSSWEGMPKVVMESLACAVPVLGSAFKLKEDIPGVFYLASLEPQAIAAQILALCENKPFVDRNKFVELYSWHSRAVQLDPIYSFAIERNLKRLEKVIGKNE